MKLSSDAESYYYGVGRVYIKRNDAKMVNEMINKLKGTKYYDKLTE